MKANKLATTVSQRQLSELTRTDGKDVSSCLDAAGITPTASDRHGDLFPLWASVRALCARKQGATASERLNNERAEKTRIEREILEGRFRPLDELREAVANLGASINKVLEDSAMPADEIERVAEALQALGGKYQD